jgi:D-serine deaminase-like pyridoxal phosphate-dependent protein
MITKKLDCEYYWCKVYIVLNASTTQASEWLSKQTKQYVEITTAKGQVDRFTISDGATRFYIYIQDTSEYSVIAHECYHLADEIMSDRGVSAEHRVGEQMAHYLEYWVRRIEKLI